MHEAIRPFMSVRVRTIMVMAILMAMPLAILGATASDQDEGQDSLLGAHEYVVQTGMAEDWVVAADAGRPLMVSIAGQPVSLELEHHDALLAGANAVRDADGDPIDLSHIGILRGVVVDDPGSMVRATVFDGRVEGLLYTSKFGYVALGSDPSGVYALATSAELVSEAKKADLSRPFDHEVHEGATDTMPETDHAHEDNTVAAIAPPGGCLQPVPPRPATPVGLVTGWPLRIMQVSFAVDHEYTQVWSDWVGEALSQANQLDGFYRREIALAVEVIDLHAHADGVLVQTGGGAALSELASHYSASHSGMDREHVHLFMGKAIDGVVAGQANCIGGAGFEDFAYTVGEAFDDDPIFFLGMVWFPDQIFKILAHEVGHIMTAHHHYANCAEHAVTYDPFVTFDACGLMFNDVGLISLEMSTANKITTRGYADLVGL